MRLTQAAAGYYWHTDDPADLPLNEHGPTEPRIVNAVQIGSGVEHNGGAETVPIEYAGLTYMGAGWFGEGRLCDSGGTTRWTGASHRFGIYGYVQPHSRPLVVIIRHDGSGTRAYVVREINGIHTWAELCARLTPELLWDICYTLTATYQRGCCVEHSRMADLLFANRIKIRKQRGTGRRTLVEL